MDALVRLLREGRTATDSRAPLVLVTDTLQTLGGRALFLQGVLDLWNALQGRRAQATGLLALLASLPPGAFAELTPADPTAVDLLVVPVSCPGEGLLEQVRQQLAGRPGLQAPCSVALVLDDLSELVDAVGFSEAADLLNQLTQWPNVSCVYAMLHEDTMPAHEAYALQSVCVCQAALRPVDSLQRDLARAVLGHDAHGEVCFSFSKRATGRLRVETMLYRMTCPHSLQLFKAPEAAAAAAAAAGAADTAKESRSDVGAAAGKEPRLGSMRLDLNPQERAAKEKVVLPYQHQGESSLYQTDNFKQYLPVAAGGHGGAQGTLGHVMYVRDSDDQYDSDEDPDDDLDF